MRLAPSSSDKSFGTRVYVCVCARVRGRERGRKRGKNTFETLDEMLLRKDNFGRSGEIRTGEWRGEGYYVKGF